MDLIVSSQLPPQLSSKLSLFDSLNRVLYDFRLAKMCHPSEWRDSVGLWGSASSSRIQKAPPGALTCHSRPQRIAYRRTLRQPRGLAAGPNSLTDIIPSWHDRVIALERKCAPLYRARFVMDFTHAALIGIDITKRTSYETAKKANSPNRTPGTGRSLAAGFR